MNEIVDITTFLTKQGIYPDMQKEILSYYDQEMYIDILKVQLLGLLRDNWYTWGEIKFKHVPNRKSYRNILKQLFEMIKRNVKNTYMVYIKDDHVKIETGGKFEIFKYDELEQHLKNETFNEKVFPFDKVVNITYRVNVKIYKEKIIND